MKCEFSIETQLWEIVVAHERWSLGGGFEILKIRSLLERWYSNDKFIWLSDYGCPTKNWEWEADIWSSIQRTKRYLAKIADRYCSKCRRSTQGKSIISWHLHSFQYYVGGRDIMYAIRASLSWLYRVTIYTWPLIVFVSTI